MYMRQTSQARIRDLESQLVAANADKARLNVELNDARSAFAARETELLRLYEAAEKRAKTQVRFICSLCLLFIVAELHYLLSPRLRPPP
jgi:hypothetical protein